MFCSTCKGSRFVPGQPVIRDGHSYDTLAPCEACKQRDQERTTKPVFQAPKIVKPPDITRGKNHDLQTEAADWIRTHQRAAERILSYAKAIALIGMKVRVKHLVERVREDGVKEGWPLAEYQINNSHTAYIARWLLEQEPEKFNGAIEFRTAKWADE